MIYKLVLKNTFLLLLYAIVSCGNCKKNIHPSNNSNQKTDSNTIKQSSNRESINPQKENFRAFNGKGQRIGLNKLIRSLWCCAIPAQKCGQQIRKFFFQRRPKRIYNSKSWPQESDADLKKLFWKLCLMHRKTTCIRGIQRKFQIADPPVWLRLK